MRPGAGCGKSIEPQPMGGTSLPCLLGGVHEDVQTATCLRVVALNMQKILTADYPGRHLMMHAQAILDVLGKWATIGARAGRMQN